MEFKHNYKLVIKYIGTNYHGWQKQPNQITVQEVIENTLVKFIKHPVKLYASGRTDAGVHSLGQVANFKTLTHFKPDEIKKFLNATLPRDISIVSCKEVSLKFHSRFSAKGKSYIYKVYTHPDPFLKDFGWYISKKLDIHKINEGIAFLKNQKNLISLSKKGEYLREEIDIRELYLKIDGYIFEFNITASHFLRYMVRKIVGHLIHIGTGRISLEEFKNIVLSKDPAKSMFIAPPQGLFLKQVYYLPEDEEL